MINTHFINIGDLVLYKNNQFIAFNKPTTLPVQEDKTKDTALLNLAEIYTKSKLHLIHRIDRPTSGIVLFAKNKKALTAVQQQFQNRTVEKTYLAIVKNMPEPTNGELVHFLKKDSRKNRSHAYIEAVKGSKKAVLTYEHLASSDHYQLLKVNLKTGRHHQIRAQFAATKNPLKGDVKYGFRRNNPDRSIQLHAYKLCFTHPVSKERIEIVAPPPTTPIWEAFSAQVAQ